jgi:hypothetical protein
MRCAALHNTCTSPALTPISLPLHAQDMELDDDGGGGGGGIAAVAPPIPEVGWAGLG